MRPTLVFVLAAGLLGLAGAAQADPPPRRLQLEPGDNVNGADNTARPGCRVDLAALAVVRGRRRHRGRPLDQARLLQGTPRRSRCPRRPSPRAPTLRSRCPERWARAA